MKKTTLLVGLLAMAGCVSAKPPTMYVSSKTPVEFVECVVQEAPTAYASTPLPGGGFRVTRPSSGTWKTHSGGTWSDSIEIRPNGEGSEITSYAGYGFRGDLRRKCLDVADSDAHS